MMQNRSEIINYVIHLEQTIIQIMVHPKRIKTIPKRLTIMRTFANLRVLKSYSLRIYQDGQLIGELLLPFCPLIQICCSFESKSVLVYDSRMIGDILLMFIILQVV
ncbi:unnamed protein product [Paramecium sonneborni]|uniref:Uncharacterized protein n=1 Tax=Paramecium sonneborni TaxID=65129 RepID=A0A8S1QQR6_9CILI|nr:unnamed protein product [Paramecium sonneborni]